jgi:N utilization substance protein B
MAVQMLYQSDLGESAPQAVLDGFDPLELVVEPAAQGGRSERSAAADTKELARAADYAKSLVRGALEHREEIDGLIGQQAENWRLERMPAVDRNVLRLAVFEFLYETDVPKLVILDEAIELAKKYGSEQSGRFVNGVLDGLLKAHQFPGSLT